MKNRLLVFPFAFYLLTFSLRLYPQYVVVHHDP